MGNRDQVLISATELADLIQAGTPVTILDVRWRLDETDGRAAYEQGHIPGAVYASLEDDLSNATLTGRGRHPLPSGSAVQDAARRWGIQQDGLVVTYDDWNRVGSSRAWWVLTAAGIGGVRILDGGLPAWKAAGGGVETGTVDPQPGDVTVRHEDLYAGARPTLSAQQCGRGAVTLLDARPAERYRADNEPADAVAGHIPGAKNLPFAAILDQEGGFVDDDTLAELFSARGADGDDVGAYCGSGVSATVLVAALASRGRDAALFPGSWSEWSSDPSRPVSRGAE